EPGFECEAFGFTAAVSECGNDGFVHHVVLADGVAQNLLGGFTEIKLAFDETLEPGQVDVDVGADIVARNQGSLHGGEGILERDLPSRTQLFPPTPTWELVSRPKEVFVARNLLQQVVEGSLDGRGCDRRFPSRGHLARRQT